MLALSFGLWFCVVFGFRVAFFGNPLYGAVTSQSREMLEHIEEATLQRDEVTDPEVLGFLRSFSRYSLMELALFALELFLIVYLWMNEVLIPVCILLFVKNVAGIGVSIWFASRRKDEGMFLSLYSMPKSLVWLDRLSAFLSGVGCLLLFLAVNDLVIG